MTQDPEIQLAVEWEKWQPRIIKFASINAAGKKLPPTSTTSQLLALTKQNVPAGMYDCMYIFMYSIYLMTRQDGSSGSFSAVHNCG